MKGVTEKPYLTEFSNGWAFTNDIVKSTFYKNPEDAFVQLRKVIKKIAGEYGAMVMVIEFKEEAVKLKVEPMRDK